MLTPTTLPEATKFIILGLFLTSLELLPGYRLTALSFVWLLSVILGNYQDNASKTDQSSILSKKIYFFLRNRVETSSGADQRCIQLLMMGVTLGEPSLVVNLKSYLHLVSTVRMHRDLSLSHLLFFMARCFRNMHNATLQSDKRRECTQTSSISPPESIFSLPGVAIGQVHVKEFKHLSIALISNSVT